jgi:hypothetical protein
MTATAYPLTWPDNMPRSKNQQRSQFRTKLNLALNNVRGSIAAFSRDSGKTITNLVISSNVTLGEEKPHDSGVAAWFVWDGLQVCIAVDRYPAVEDNLQAIHHILEARRTELRHGGLNIVRATFTGFQALPSPAGQRKRTWRDVLELNAGPVTKDQVEAAYRLAAKKAHPDKGGSDDAMAELNRARADALKDIGELHGS